MRIEIKSRPPAMIDNLAWRTLGFLILLLTALGSGLLAIYGACRLWDNYLCRWF